LVGGNTSAGAPFTDAAYRAARSIIHCSASDDHDVPIRKAHGCVWLGRETVYEGPIGAVEIQEEHTFRLDEQHRVALRDSLVVQDDRIVGATPDHHRTYQLDRTV